MAEGWEAQAAVAAADQLAPPLADRLRADFSYTLDRMLVLIDESGCPGFKFTRGSDPIFGIGMVVFANGEDAATTARAIADLRIDLAHKTEFKFSKSNAHLRDRFFGCVASCRSPSAPSSCAKRPYTASTFAANPTASITIS